MDVINCPLCCNKSFPSHHELVKHLMNILENIHCPLCQSKLSSITSLIKHLNNCQRKVAPETVVLIDYNDYCKTSTSSSCISKPPCLDSKTESLRDLSSLQSTEISNEMANMYEELLQKDTEESSLENQDLRFIRENGADQFIYLANEEMTSTHTLIATKLNSDGTITLTTENVKTQNKNETQKKPGHTYSCNTCGITFASVLEHIQNYHNDQDVVVEENIDDTMIGDTLPIEDKPGSSDEITSDKQGRRVITDAGSIVETPTSLEVPVHAVEPQVVDNVQENSQTLNKLPSSTRPYALVEKFCDSYVMDLKKNEEKNGPYHKVVLKEMQTLEDGKKVKVFNCISCNTYVTNIDDLKDQPCKAKYPCPHCPVVYDNLKSLNAHMKVHKGYTGKESSSPFKCEFCCTVFSTNKSLKLHKRMHDPIKPRPIEPPVQSAKTEEVVDKFLCSICDKEIPLDYRLVHERSHSGELTYNCDVCNRKFTSFEFMEMHTKLHKMEKVATNKPDKTLLYSCSYCPRQFARPHEKVKHERIHTGEKPHSCDICGKSFRVSYCLTLHMRTHTGARPYECHHCGKKFKAHSVYNHHLLTHSDVRAYKCPYCPKAFKTSVQLAGHKNSHTKPFACQYCNRPFASLYAVRVHSETHKRQNNLKFSCELCGATYARTFALKDHIRQAHKNQSIKVKEEDWLVTEEVVQEKTVEDFLGEEISQK